MTNRFFSFALLFVSFLLITHCTSKRPPEEAKSIISTDAQAIAHGEELFQSNCTACHNFRQQAIGPNLAGVTTDREVDWLVQFIHNAPEMIDRGDPQATALYQEYQQYMPAFTTLDSTEITDIISYMHTYADQAATNLAVSDTGGLADPIPEKIQQSLLTLVLEEVTTAPATREESPLARINKLLMVPSPSPGSSERMFIHDLNGLLYEVNQGRWQVFLDIGDKKPDFITQPGLGTGLGSFAFHPDFTKNGLFYTTHTEQPDAAPADFAYHDSIPVTLQWVLTEWRMKDPNAPAFQGTSREMLRANMVAGIHGMQELTFNPTAKPDDEDYGLLYLSIGDGGSTLEGYPELCHDQGKVWGTIIRIDPLGKNSQNGQYGIPASNPFADRSQHPEALPEVWAYGFRNPHRISWDTAGDHKMLISGIGQKNAEELNLGVAGADYGWCIREGTFMIDPDGDVNVAYPLPANDATLGYTYPVAQYDHDEGRAISGGYVYRGQQIPALQGKYIFGDIVTGRLFSVQSNQLSLGQQATIQALGVQVNGQETTLEELTGSKRVDLRFGVGPEQELYLFTKADGRVWKVVDGIEVSGV